MSSPPQSPVGNSKIISNRKMNYNADMVIRDDKDDQGKGERSVPCGGEARLSRLKKNTDRQPQTTLPPIVIGFLASSATQRWRTTSILLTASLPMET